MIISVEELMALARPALARGQRVRFVARGSSMLPFIRNGDVVEVAPLSEPPQRPLRRGDIALAATAPGRYVVHRVVRAGAAGVWLRGDFQRRAEGPVARDAVLGRVTAVTREGRELALDAGVWRVAGRVWMMVHPVGRVVLGAALAVRRWAGNRG